MNNSEKMLTIELVVFTAVAIWGYFATRPPKPKQLDIPFPPDSESASSGAAKKPTRSMATTPR